MDRKKYLEISKKQPKIVDKLMDKYGFKMDLAFDIFEEIIIILTE